MIIQPQTQELLPSGEVVGECRIVRFLAGGGMGHVYLARQLKLDRLVAVKVLPPKLIDAERIARFIQEARACSRIQHAHVVTIHDAGQQGNLFYIVMQYVDGRNLKEQVEGRVGPLPWREAVRMARAAAHGLEAVHRLDLVHRDVKPANIMVTRDNHVLLMDFGLVRGAGEGDLTRSGGILGTPPYMSPEQCRGEKLDCRSDVFSLGSTLYFLLCGQVPYLGPIEAVVNRIANGERPPPLDGLVPTLPREVDAVSRAMSPLKQDRYATALEMARALGKLLKRTGQADDSLDTTAIQLAMIDTQPLIKAEAIDEPPTPAPPVVVLPIRPVPTPPRPRVTPAPRLFDTPSAPVGRRPDLAAWFERHKPLIFSAAAALLVLAVLLIVLLVPPDTDKTPAPTPGDRQDMVRIPGGPVHLGNERDQVRTHLESFLAALAPHDKLADVATGAERQQLFDRVLDEALEDERQVQVGQFWIDAYEVTNAQYALFVQATGRRPPPGWSGNQPPAGRADHPVDNVSYADAAAYAAWVGKQLPSSAQWTRAFRGDADSLFPWGDQYGSGRANTVERGGGATTAVTATPRDCTAAGVYNLVGNVSEFVREETLVAGQPCVGIKGASYRMYGVADGVGGVRQWVATTVAQPGVGFRCVVEGP